MKTLWIWLYWLLLWAWRFFLIAFLYLNFGPLMAVVLFGAFLVKDAINEVRAILLLGAERPRR